MAHYLTNDLTAIISLIIKAF